MIIDRIENAQQYACLGPAWKTAMDAMQSYDPAAFQSGKTPLDNGVSIVQIEEESHPRSASKLEAHRDYADVMFLSEGEEIFYCKPTAELTNITREYDPSIEALLADNDEDSLAVPMKPGLFMVFLPQDAHAPGCELGKPMKSRRIVLKVPLK